MSDGHTHASTFEGMNDEYKRRLMIVTALNVGMFLVEMVAGQFAGSQALKADALDFFADGLTYALSFWAIGKAARCGAIPAVQRPRTKRKRVSEGQVPPVTSRPAYKLTHCRVSLRSGCGTAICEAETVSMDGHRWLKFLAFVAFALIVAALALHHSLHRP